MTTIKLANTQNLVYYPVIILGPQVLSHGFAARACDKSILSKHQQLQSEILLLREYSVL